MLNIKLKEKSLIFFILPAIIFLIVFSLYPIFYGILLSFYSWDLREPNPEFVGLKNYVEVIQDPNFQASLIVTLKYGIPALTIQILLGFLIALLLDTKIRGRRFFLTINLIPLMISWAMVGLLFRWLFNYDYGIVNYFLNLAGIKKIPWLGDPTYALWSIIIVDVWQYSPICTLIFFAGLQSLPREPIEAAMVDGASRLQILRHVIIPSLKPLILFVCAIRTMDALRIFDQVAVMTGGGPGFATETLGIHIYRTSFKYLFIGMGAAMSVYFLLLISSLIIVYIRIMYRKEKEW
jgi:ABC-type sugar transport system permease subunit